MKRRKRKRKHKQESRLADQVMNQSETEKSATPVEMPVEVENSESYIELQSEVEDLANPVEIHDETEEPTGTVVFADPEAPMPRSAPPTGADGRTHPGYAFPAATRLAAPDPVQ